MNLAETIYRKSSGLSEQQALEVINFIDFLTTRSQSANNSHIAHLKNTSLDWGGKPILNRDELHDGDRS